jgi:hypothetical protein
MDLVYQEPLLKWSQSWERLHLLEMKEDPGKIHISNRIEIISITRALRTAGIDRTESALKRSLSRSLSPSTSCVSFLFFSLFQI